MMALLAFLAWIGPPNRRVAARSIPLRQQWSVAMHNSNAYGAQYQRAADDPFSTNQPYESSASNWKTDGVGTAKSTEDLNPIADFLKDQVSRALVVGLVTNAMAL